MRNNADSVNAQHAATIMSESADASLTGAVGGPGQPQGECELLGPFALLVQAALGALALLSLVWKRWRERPQRPVKVWFFDASKQVFGSVLVHASNIFLSMLTSGRFTINSLAQRSLGGYIPNPCSFYLLNLAIDTTLGIPILILLIRLFTHLASLTPLGKPLESIQSGYYGHPPNSWWWLKQSVIYFTGLFGMKICVLLIFLLFPWISRVGDWALRWTEGDEKLQVAFVMMIFPLIMNALQYYIIDSLIKEPIEHAHHPLPSEDGDEDEAQNIRIYDHADEDEEEEVEGTKTYEESDAQTIVGSSSSHVARSISNSLPKE